MPAAAGDTEAAATRLRPDRPAVVLLHGQPGSARDWSRVLRALDGRAAAIALDRPGWGPDGGPAQDLEGNARTVLAALDARGVERAAIAGHSLGAAVGAWLAARHPERVSALVLAAPAANLASLERLDRWLATRPGHLAASLALAGAGLALAAPSVRRRLAGDSGLEDQYLLAAGRALLSPRAWRSFHVEQRALLHDLPVLERELGRIRAPVTILAGARDRVVPAQAERRLAAQIPHAQLRVLPHAGHLLPQRHPGPVADAIAAAIDSASYPPANARAHART